jgi:regulator of replication initiation timing
VTEHSTAESTCARFFLFFEKVGMDIQAIWIVVVAVSVPIGASIGFAIQLRQLRQSLLENQKLALELKELQTRLDNAEKVIVRATPEEIEAYGNTVTSRDIMMARGAPWTGVNPGPDDGPAYRSPMPTLSERLAPAAIAGVVLAFFAYLLYDLIRVGMWFYTALTS